MLNETNAPYAPPRQLGFWMALALVVGNMIGSGIFLLPANLAPFGTNALIGVYNRMVDSLRQEWGKLRGEAAQIPRASLPSPTRLWAQWTELKALVDKT